MNYLTTKYEHLEVTLDQSTLVVTLNRPDASNAYSVSLVRDLVHTLNHADQDKSVRVILLRANGKNFCAGGDIKSMSEKTGMFAGDPAELREHYHYGIQQIPRAFQKLQKVVVASIQGAAIGAGCDLAAMCDLRIASQDASFAETFAKIGLVPGDGGAFFMIRAIGHAKATEMFLLGKKYSAMEAQQMGLVHEVVPFAELEKRSVNLCHELSTMPETALKLTKRALVNAYEQSLDAHLELMSAFQGIAQRTSDHFEALDRIKQKK